MGLVVTMAVHGTGSHYGCPGDWYTLWLSRGLVHTMAVHGTGSHYGCPGDWYTLWLFMGLVVTMAVHGTGSHYGCSWVAGKGGHARPLYPRNACSVLKLCAINLCIQSVCQVGPAWAPHRYAQLKHA